MVNIDYEKIRELTEKIVEVELVKDYNEKLITRNRKRSKGKRNNDRRQILDIKNQF